MGDLYLSRKLSRNNSPVSISWALNWGPTSPAFRSKVSRTSRASGISNHEESDVEELEMLLEVRCGTVVLLFADISLVE